MWFYKRIMTTPWIDTKCNDVLAEVHSQKELATQNRRKSIFIGHVMRRGTLGMPWQGRQWAHHDKGNIGHIVRRETLGMSWQGEYWACHEKGDIGHMMRRGTLDMSQHGDTEVCRDNGESWTGREAEKRENSCRSGIMAWSICGRCLAGQKAVNSNDELYELLFFLCNKGNTETENYYITWWSKQNNRTSYFPGILISQTSNVDTIFLLSIYHLICTSFSLFYE